MSGALPAFLPAHHAHGLQIPVLLDDNQLRCYNCHIYITDSCCKNMNSGEMLVLMQEQV